MRRKREDGVPEKGKKVLYYGFRLCRRFDECDGFQAKGRQRRQDEDVVTALPRPAFFPRHQPLGCFYCPSSVHISSSFAVITLVLAASLTQFTFYSPTSLYSSSSMALSSLSLPSISISLAPADDPPVEPFSPFDTQPPSPAIQDDNYRPSLLSPPPVVSPRFLRQPSPLRPADTLPAGKGLDSGQFEALLASTRERNAGVRKEPDLRKELAMKSHKSKQRMLLLNSFFSNLIPIPFQWNVALYSCPRSKLLLPPRLQPSQKLPPSLRLSFIIPSPPRASIPHWLCSSLCSRKTFLDQPAVLLSSRGSNMYNIVN